MEATQGIGKSPLRTGSPIHGSLVLLGALLPHGSLPALGALQPDGSLLNEQITFYATKPRL
ncbi:MAG: hypothetical protein WCB12_01300 [Bryobacteraceae bacterium]